MLDWNDLRYFLAVADAGSTLAAARELRAEPDHGRRRIAALEEALRLTLFDRRQAGYALTPDGERLLDHARGSASRRSARFERRRRRAGPRPIAARCDSPPRRSSRSPCCRRCCASSTSFIPRSSSTSMPPAISATSAPAKPTSRLRATRSPQSAAGVVGRRLCSDDWALLLQPRLRSPQRHSRGHRRAQRPCDHRRRRRQRLARIPVLASPDRRSSSRSRSTRRRPAACSPPSAPASGIAVLPCLVADSEADLVQCFPPREGHERVMWLLTHDRVRHSPRVRLVTDFLYERLETAGQRASARRLITRR